MTIQRTNIEHILEENLWPEIRLLRNKINELEAQTQELSEREGMLVRIAEVAGIAEAETYTPDPRD